AADPAFRKRIYLAAANSLDRSGRDEASLIALRKQMAAVISTLEEEVTGKRLVTEAAEASRPDPLAAPEPTVAADPVVTDGAARRNTAQVKPTSEVGGKRPTPAVQMPRQPAGGSPAPALRVEPKQETVAKSVGVSAERKPVIEPKKRPFSFMLASTVGIAILVAGGIFAFSTGAFQSAEERDTSIPNPPTRLEQESSANGIQRAPALASQSTSEGMAEAEGWVTIFTPADPTVLNLVGGAQASLKSDPFGDFAQLQTAAQDAFVELDVPLGVLLQMQGQTVQVNLIARSDDGNPTEMSVTCDFGELGDCGRRRFLVGQSPAEYLFRLNMPEVRELEQGGKLMIRADIKDYSRPVNLLAVRIRAVQQS
ncbi:MAG: hypothetical protein AAGI92_13365, partial [Pseudomonadota bacterium]